MKKKSDSGELTETPQEKELANRALESYQRYKSTWLPVQQRAIAATQSMGKAGSTERRALATKMQGGAGEPYQAAAEALPGQAGEHGIRTDSGAYRMAAEGISQGKAGAQGIAGGAAENAIDSAYAEGLASIVGQGQKVASAAMQSTAGAARFASADQQARARAQAQRRAGFAKYLGMGIGAAGGIASMGGMGTPGGGTEAMGTGAAPGEAAGSFVGRF